jgi:demethylmenaquinone methyltransferase/2-methoxy-6-polyprenyl-1,4-benzoquinol methylase
MESEETSTDQSEPPDSSPSYDFLSRFYDTISAPGEKRFTQAGLALLAPAHNETVLEIGFGTGRSLVSLARAVGENGRVYGIDLSKGMMRVTQNRLNAAGLNEQVVLEQGNATKLPFEPSFFDAVFMSFTLELFPPHNIPRVLAECRRVLKPDGRLGLVSLVETNPLSVSQRLYLWAHHTFPRIVDCRPIPAVPLLEKAGYRIIRHEQNSLQGVPVSMIVAKHQIHPEA